MKKFIFIVLLQLILSASYAQNQSSDTLQTATFPPSLSEKIDHWFAPKVAIIYQFLFFDPFSTIGIYDPLVYDNTGKPILDSSNKPIEKHIPLIVVWLVFGAIFFTLRMKFINFRALRHAIHLIQGKFDHPDHKGEVSHFQALATAVSGTVGLGNIAGVAIAITVGGPGATFWMIIAGILGMTLKFTEVTLGVKYRNISSEGIVSGGPMFYLSNAFKTRKFFNIPLANFGKGLALIYAFFLIGASIGGGNMFQANQTFQQFALLFPILDGQGALVGLFLAVLVGFVIIGGIKSIAKVTSKIVPIMAIIYIGSALIIIGMHYREIPEVLKIIFNGAFYPEALKGGFLGVLIVGFQRASFSNEAGIGSSSIAHSAVKTDEPVSEGLVALLEPVVDTVVICTLTALVIVFTGYYEPSLAMGLNGAQLTSKAFESVFSWFPYVLGISIILFAVSTMISWSYYGLNSFKFLFQKYFDKWGIPTKWLHYGFFIFFLSFTIIGAASNLGSVTDFADMMILTLAFPNLIGLYFLSGEVYHDLRKYLSKVKSGEISQTTTKNA